MQTATLIISCASLLVSTAALVVIVVGAKKAEKTMFGIKFEAENKINSLKRAVADL